jgi:hypothetical protein
MALTPSTMLPLGTEAPAFALASTDGTVVSLKDFDQSAVLVVIFMCNHCPYVKHLYGGLVDFGRGCLAKGVAIVGINANNAGSHPADSFEKMIEEKRTVGYPFPLPARSVAGSREGLRGRLHPGFLRVRRGTSASLPGPVRRQPPRIGDSGHGQGPPCGRGCLAGGRGSRRITASLPGLQHQVEGGQRARLLPLVSIFFCPLTGRGSGVCFPALCRTPNSCAGADAGWSSWQLVGLITRRSQVRILPPLPHLKPGEGCPCSK